MTNKNISDTYDKLITAVTLLSDKLEKGLPRFTEAEFLGGFGTEFQNQLSDSGRNILQSLLAEDILNSEPTIISEQFQKDYQEIENTFTTNFLASLDLDPSIKMVQEELQKKLATKKEQLFKDFMNKLNGQRHRFSPEDEIKIKTTFIKYLDKNYTELNNRLEKFKDLPAIYTKYLSHEKFTETQTKANKNLSHSFTRDPVLEELLSLPKPEPEVGFRVDKKNLKKQILSDIASGKEPLEIKVTVPNPTPIFSRICDIGLQQRTPALSIVYLLVFLFAVFLRDHKKRVIKALNEVIEENQLFDLDLNKLTLEMVYPPANGEKQGKVISKGFLDPDHLNKLQSLLDKNKKEISEYHLKNIKKPLSTVPAFDEDYSTDEEKIPYSGPRP